MYNLISIESNQSSNTATNNGTATQAETQCGCKNRMRAREQDIDRMIKHGKFIDLLTAIFWLLACIYLFILITRKTKG